MAEAMSAYVRFFVKDEVSTDAKKVEANAKSAADGMDKAGESGGKRFTDGLAKAGNAAKSGAKMIAGVGVAAVGLVGSMIALATGTQEYTEDMGKLTTAFGTARDATGELKWSTDDAKGTYQDFVGILGETDQAVEASNHLAELATSQQDLNKWGTIAAGVYARFGDSLPLEGLTEAANETAKVGTVTGSLADALNWAGKNEDEFNAQLAECNSEQERAQLITDTLSGLYEEAGNQYKDTNADLIAARQAQSDFNGMMAEAGGAVQPFVTALQNTATELGGRAMPYIQQFAEYIAAKMPEVQQYLSDVANKLAEAWSAAQPIVQPVLDAIKGVFEWFIQNLPSLIPWIAGIAAAFVGFQVISGIITAVKTAMDLWRTATTLMTGAQWLLNAAMSANPIGIVIAIIAALIGIIVYLWNTNEDFRNAVTQAWEFISKKASEIFGAIGKFLSDIWNSISSTASSVWNSISSTISSVWNSISSTVSSVVSGISSTVSNVFNGIRSTVSGIWNGIKDTISNAINAAKGVVGGAINAIKGIMNFSWSLPPLKLPHFSIQGEFSLNPPSIPTLGVSWYAKGAVFDGATLLPAAGGYAGVGEAGAEAVAPISTLMDYVRTAVSDAMGGGGGFTSNIYVQTGETSEDKLARMIAREERRNAYNFGLV